MLRNKDISKIKEIETFFTNSWLQPDFFQNSYLD